MLTPDFAYCHVVTLEKYLGREINRETYGAPVAVRARIDMSRKRTYRQGGQAAQEIVATGTVFLPANAKVDAQDRLTFGNTTYTVIESRPCYWLDGSINHVEVLIQ